MVAAFVLRAEAAAPYFGPGNLAILSLGNSSQPLNNSGNTIFVQQFYTNGVLVSSIMVPDAGTGAMLISGTAASEGGLTRSADHTSLVFGGYSTNLGAITGSLSKQTGAALPRAIGRVDARGLFSMAASSTTVYSANNIRGATSDGTNGFWTAGAGDATTPGGTWYFNPPQPPVDVQVDGGNTLCVKIMADSLYFSTQKGTTGIYVFSGPGLPRAGAATNLLIATGSSSQPAGFDMDLGQTIMYVADQRVTGGGGIQKWTNNAGVWGLAYTLPTGNASGAFAVAADFSGAAPVLYATTVDSASSNTNRLVKIIDSGAAATPTLLASSGAHSAFRGLDWVPDLRPFIVAPPVSQVVTNGSDVEFSVAASSPYALSYQWQQNGANLSGATTSALALRGVTTAAQGAYHVVVTNLYGAVTSADASLTVKTVVAPPQVVTPPADQSVLIGGAVVFTVSLAGTTPFNYQWQFDGADLLAQTNATLSLAGLVASAAGDYRVRVSNLAGATTSAAATLTILVPASSYVPYPSAGLVYTQSFDSLPNPGTVSVNADNPVTIDGVTFGLSDPFDFAFPVISNGVSNATGIGFGGLGLASAMPGWYAVADVQPKFGASAGDQSTGGVISFGATNSASASANRALGLIATSSTGGTAFGVKFVNETADTLTRMTLRFTGELWRQSAAAKSLAVSYWIDPTATNPFPATSTGVLTNLNVSFPANPAATNPIPVNGAASGNQLSAGVADQAIADWPPGAALWLVWRMGDPAAKGQGLAIDDLAFSASAAPPLGSVSLAIRLAGASVVISWPTVPAGFALQSTSDPGLAGSWSAVSQSVMVSNGVSTVTLPVIASRQFFRLQE